MTTATKTHNPVEAQPGEVWILTQAATGNPLIRRYEDVVARVDLDPDTGEPTFYFESVYLPGVEDYIPVADTASGWSGEPILRA